jgi:hypothetical protein
MVEKEQLLSALLSQMSHAYEQRWHLVHRLHTDRLEQKDWVHRYHQEGMERRLKLLETLADYDDR